MSLESSQNIQKNILCKKMNIYTCNESCKRSHNIDELIIDSCIYGIKCKNSKCPFIHPGDNHITKEEYFQRMYKYISPYENEFTTICRYIDIGCKIEKCRKAHSIQQLKISECDCYRDNCPFYHNSRDCNITKEEYFQRMKDFTITLNKSNKNMLCRYVNIGCQRNDCPYAHNINELEIKKCIFSNCKSNCVFLHKNEIFNLQQYYKRMLEYIEPIKPKTVLCHLEKCNNYNCKYAHSYEELIISNCIRGIKCKKHCCPFKHPNENFDKNVYYKRMLHSMYPN